jgi:hypothetical protein
MTSLKEQPAKNSWKKKQKIKMKQQWEEKQGQWGAPSKNCDRAPKEKSFSSSQQIANQLLRGTTHRTSACTFNERNLKQWNDAQKHQERTQQQNQKNRNSGGYDEKKKAHQEQWLS